MNKPRLYFVFILFFLITAIQNTQAQQSTNTRYALIPYPQELKAGSGNFTINTQTKIIADADVLSNEIEQLQELFPSLNLKQGEASANFIKLNLDSSIEHREGYRLTVATNGITIKAAEPVGVFRAIETIRQLAPTTVETAVSAKSFSLPVVTINDYPVYNYRGMHLDVARHFFSMDYVKKFIDRMALYKFNKFHFHLTDDQGWRVEIKQYPLLTEKGAWREFNSHDLECIDRAKKSGNPDYLIDPKHIKMVNGKPIYGGFYTQQELKDLVAYAKTKHIDIIPEIDMPGHQNIAIQNYPYLACGDTNWEEGNFSVPMCPCNEQTFEFAQNVYKEIFEIFPYEYVHLGADEVNKNSWEKSAACKVMMDKEGIKNVNELQSYFVHRMEKFFNDNGRKLIGWDEILEGGISPTANVMYWRSWVPQSPILAANNGNNVIMTPGEPLYFDALPNKQSLYNVYHFNPIPKALTEEQAKNILGAQGNVWTEWIPSEERLEYMVYPRKLALSEVLWTNKQNYTSFRNRLSVQQKRLETMGVNYRLPDIDGLLENYVFVQNGVLNVKSPAPDLILRYTSDGSMPDAKSTILNKPVTVTKPTTFKIAAFTKNGLRGDVYTVEYDKQPYNASVTKKGSGLNVQFFKGVWKSTEELLNKEADDEWIQDDVSVPESKVKGTDVFGLIYKGYITVPADGIYSFHLNSDDGSLLKIADRLVIDNDGFHPATEKSGQIALRKGAHPFELRFIEGGGGYKLELKTSGPVNKTKKDIPLSWFK